MRVEEILREGRAIWGDQKLKLAEVVVRLGVTFGDLCRCARGADKDPGGREELEKEIGNIIVSCVRWADDLGLDVQGCIDRALVAQRLFAERNKKR